MWAPRKTDLARLREIKGLEDLHNPRLHRRWPAVHPNGPACSSGPGASSIAGLTRRIST